jgi:hypothetical protein
VAPAAAVAVPPQSLVGLVATTSPAGSVSGNATPTSATVLAAGLVMVKVSDVSDRDRLRAEGLGN